mmetsp:Transcript_35356/g.61743  ORF Transcript_35356/g.61743 Transcript_35356/m.61743 type:complete len:300 (-) Transcript_35356:643-1542(-)
MAIMPKILMIPTIVLLLCCFVLSSSSGSERPSLFEKNGVQRIIRDAVPEPGQRKSTTNKIFLELHGGGALEQGLSSPVKVSRQILKSDGEKDILPAPNDSSPLPSRNRVLLSMSYLAGMGVCGIVLAALGSSLNGLATNCGTSAVKVGTVFVARGAGAVAGTLSSARLYNALPGRLVAGTALAFFHRRSAGYPHDHQYPDPTHCIRCVWSLHSRTGHGLPDLNPQAPRTRSWALAGCKYSGIWYFRLCSSLDCLHVWKLAAAVRGAGGAGGGGGRGPGPGPARAPRGRPAPRRPAFTSW